MRLIKHLFYFDKQKKCLKWKKKKSQSGILIPIPKKLMKKFQQILKNLDGNMIESRISTGNKNDWNGKYHKGLFTNVWFSWNISIFFEIESAVHFLRGKIVPNLTIILHQFLLASRHSVQKFQAFF